jgi:hypothetical protein
MKTFVIHAAAAVASRAPAGRLPGSAPLLDWLRESRWRAHVTAAARSVLGTRVAAVRGATP